MNPIWNEQEKCVAKRGDKVQGIFKRATYLGGRVRKAGELFSFEIREVPDNKFQTQEVIIESECNPMFGESVDSWDLTNLEILP
jgi:hypothetical protein